MQRKLTSQESINYEEAVIANDGRYPVEVYMMHIVIKGEEQREEMRRESADG